MGRGLSINQKLILGLAYGVNKGVGTKSGMPVPNYRVRTVNYSGLKDMFWTLAAHRLFDLPFTNAGQHIVKSNGTIQEAGGYFDLTHKEARSAKVSTIRAMSSLFKRDLLVLAPQENVYRWGYVLTESGYKLAEEYQEPVSDWEIFRSGMVEFPGNYRNEFIFIANLLQNNEITLPAIIESLTSGQRINDIARHHGWRSPYELSRSYYHQDNS